MTTVLLLKEGLAVSRMWAQARFAAGKYPLENLNLMNPMTKRLLAAPHLTTVVTLLPRVHLGLVQAKVKVDILKISIKMRKSALIISFALFFSLLFVLAVSAEDCGQRLAANGINQAAGYCRHTNAEAACDSGTSLGATSDCEVDCCKSNPT